MSIELPSGDEPQGAPEEQLSVPRHSRSRFGWILVVLLAGVTVWALTRPSHVPALRHLARPSHTVSAQIDPPAGDLPVVPSAPVYRRRSLAWPVLTCPRGEVDQHRRIPVVAGFRRC